MPTATLIQNQRAKHGGGAEKHHGCGQGWRSRRGVNMSPLRTGSGGATFTVPGRHMKNLGRVQCLAISRLGNLLPTTKAVRNHQRLPGCFANVRKKLVLTDS